MDWLDVEDISSMLEELYPDVDIFSLRFTELKSMVVALPGFSGDVDGCNERILESIQMEWSQVREG